jgi:hypothetical protein
MDALAMSARLTLSQTDLFEPSTKAGEDQLTGMARAKWECLLHR